MMKYSSRHLIAAACSALMCASAHASRPFFAEDGGVLEKSSCELESVVAHASADGMLSATQLTTQVGCGVGQLMGIATQLAAGAGRLHSDGSTDKAFWVAGKSGWSAADNSALMLALAYGANWLRPAGGPSRLETVFVNLVVTKQMTEKVTGHVNLGWLGNRPAKTSVATWNAVLEYAVTDAVDVGAEVFGAEHASAFTGVGMRWAVSKALSLNAGHAVQKGDPRNRLSSLGIKLAF